MKCPKCQSENPEGVKFCGGCGAGLQAILVCPHCNHSNPPGVLLFCHERGRPLIDSAVPLTAQPSQPPLSVPTSFANGRYQVKKFDPETVGPIFELCTDPGQYWTHL